jgi:hypothetical protein
MAAKLARLAHKIVIQLHLVAESSTICSSRSWQPVRKLLDTPSVHLCLERDSNPWSQFSSGQNPYVPETSRPLGPWEQEVNKLKHFGTVKWMRTVHSWHKLSTFRFTSYPRADQPAVHSLCSVLKLVRKCVLFEWNWGLQQTNTCANACARSEERYSVHSHTFLKAFCRLLNYSLVKYLVVETRRRKRRTKRAYLHVG